MVLATDNSGGCDVCPCCDLDTRDDRMSLSQGTEVTVAESDRGAMQLGAPIDQQPRTREERHVNGIFVYGSRAQVVLNDHYEFANCGWQRCPLVLGGNGRPCARRPAPAAGLHSDAAESGRGRNEGAVPPAYRRGPAGGSRAPPASPPNFDLPSPAAAAGGGRRGAPASRGRGRRQGPRVLSRTRRCDQCHSAHCFETRLAFDSHMNRAHGCTVAGEGSTCPACPPDGFEIPEFGAWRPGTTGYAVPCPSAANPAADA